MIRILGIFLGALTLAGPIAAANVRDCAQVATDAALLAEPWEQNTRLFSNGKVRLAILDTIEPTAGAFHLLILSPPFDGPIGVTCQVVSFAGDLGYGKMTLDDMSSEYDPARGLIFGVAITVGPDVDTPGRLSFVLNQTTGAIQAEDIFP